MPVGDGVNLSQYGSVSISGGSSALNLHMQGKVGLKASDVALPIKKGDFYAYLDPLLLVQVESHDETTCTFQGWVDPMCLTSYCPPDRPGEVKIFTPLTAERYRYLWFHDSTLELGDDFASTAGPGAIYLERSTSRLLFLGPTRSEGRKVEVFADWDVLEGGFWISSDRFTLFRQGSQVGWNNSSSRFDLIG